MDFPSAQPVASAEGPTPPIFVANLKVGGSVHRIAPGMDQLPRPKRRTTCGWRYGKGGTLISTFTRLDGSGRRCRKCFPSSTPEAEHDPNNEDCGVTDSIEEFE